VSKVRFGVGGKKPGRRKETYESDRWYIIDEQKNMIPSAKSPVIVTEMYVMMQGNIKKDGKVNGKIRKEVVMS